MDISSPLLRDLDDLLVLFEDPSVTLLESGTVRIGLLAEAVAVPLKTISSISRIADSYGWDAKIFGDGSGLVILLDRPLHG